MQDLALETTELEQLLLSGAYREVLARLSTVPQLSVRLLAIKGMVHLRLGALKEAEGPLEQAAAAGDAEANVEYGNLLRSSGRLDAAAELLGAMAQSLDDDLRLRARRWLGVTLYQQGFAAEAARMLESVRREYDLRQDPLGGARVRLNISMMWFSSGTFTQAFSTLEPALVVFREQRQWNLLRTGLANMASVLEALHRVAEMPALLAELESLLPAEESVEHVTFWMFRAGLYRHGMIDRETYVALVAQVTEVAAAYGMAEHQDWALQARTALLIEEGRDREATRLILQAPRNESGDLAAPYRVLHASVLERSGDLASAETELRLAVDDFARRTQRAQQARAELKLAAVLYRRDCPQDAVQVLRSALEGMIRTNVHPELRREFQDLQDLTQFASLEPSLQAYLEPVLDSLQLQVARPVQAQGRPLTLRTFGEVSLCSAQGPGRPSGLQALPGAAGEDAAAVLAALLLSPGLTRADLAHVLAEGDVPGSEQQVRRALLALRALLGEHLLGEAAPDPAAAGGLVYRVSGAPSIDFDVARFGRAVSARDVPRALALASGTFFPQRRGAWVQSVRTRVRTDLITLLSLEMDAAEAAGDPGRWALLDARRQALL